MKYGKLFCLALALLSSSSVNTFPTISILPHHSSGRRFNNRVGTEICLSEDEDMAAKLSGECIECQTPQIKKMVESREKTLHKKNSQEGIRGEQRFTSTKNDPTVAGAAFFALPDPPPKLLAVLAPLLALSIYFGQALNPTPAITLLNTMAVSSPTYHELLTNGKPTAVEFWAAWCPDCRESAPTVYRSLYGRDDLNLLSINADEASARALIDYFGVDAIPQINFVDGEGSVSDHVIIGSVRDERELEREVGRLVANRNKFGNDEVDGNWREFLERLEKKT